MDKLTSDNKWAQVPEWVINLDISHTAFRLYAVLARYADNVTGEAFPARDTLANRLGCSEKTIDRAVLDLVEHGAIQKVNRGRYQSAVYTVVTALPLASSVSSDGTAVSSEETNLSEREDKNDHITITNQLDLLKVEPLNVKEKPISQSQEGFDEFWKVYPRGEDKPDARKAFARALKRVSFEDLIAGAIRHRDDPNRNPQWTKYAHRWLDKDGWDNSLKPATEVLNEWGRPFAKSAESPGVRAWVKAGHDRGEHWACRPGEFEGC